MNEYSSKNIIKTIIRLEKKKCDYFEFSILINENKIASFNFYLVGILYGNKFKVNSQRILYDVFHNKIDQISYLFYMRSIIIRKKKINFTVEPFGFSVDK